VAQIVDADVGNVGLHAHPLPEAFEVNHRLVGHVKVEEEMAAFGHGITGQADPGDGMMHHAVSNIVQLQLQAGQRLFSHSLGIKIEVGDQRVQSESLLQVQRLH